MHNTQGELDTSTGQWGGFSSGTLPDSYRDPGHDRYMRLGVNMSNLNSVNTSVAYNIRTDGWRSLVFGKYTALGRAYNEQGTFKTERSYFVGGNDPSAEVADLNFDRMPRISAVDMYRGDGLRTIHTTTTCQGILILKLTKVIYIRTGQLLLQRPTAPLRSSRCGRAITTCGDSFTVKTLHRLEATTGTSAIRTRQAT